MFVLMLNDIQKLAQVEFDLIVIQYYFYIRFDNNFNLLYDLLYYLPNIYNKQYKKTVTNESNTYKMKTNIRRKKNSGGYENSQHLKK